jgi:hypothetical protein
MKAQTPCRNPHCRDGVCYATKSTRTPTHQGKPRACEECTARVDAVRALDGLEPVRIAS